MLGRDYPTGRIHGEREQAPVYFQAQVCTLDAVTGKEEGTQMLLVGVPQKGTPDLQVSSTPKSVLFYFLFRLLPRKLICN